MKKECAFCDNVSGREREILRNDLVWAFPTNIPIVPGHTLICPVRCVGTFEELTQEERDAIFSAMEKIKKSLRKGFGAEGFNHAWNENKVGGQSVPHFHLHLLPRKATDTNEYGYEPRQFLYRSTADRELSQIKELKQVAEDIKKNF